MRTGRQATGDYTLLVGLVRSLYAGSSSKRNGIRGNAPPLALEPVPTLLFQLEEAGDCGSDPLHGSHGRNRHKLFAAACRYDLEGIGIPATAPGDLSSIAAALNQLERNRIQEMFKELGAKPSTGTEPR